MLFTDKQTNRQTNATKNITSFAKEVIKAVSVILWGVASTEDRLFHHLFRADQKSLTSLHDTKKCSNVSSQLHDLQFGFSFIFALKS